MTAISERDQLAYVAARAAERGARILLLDQVPIRDRDFTGGVASELWSGLA